MEMAICLAIIGFALVAIIGVLPYGMNTQRDNREETVVNQDATVLIEAIRNGARGADYLTNYVFAIVNHWTNFTTHASDVDVYTISNAIVKGNSLPYYSLTNGANIIGVLSTPEFTDESGLMPLPTLTFGGVSNHIVAYIRSLSGPAAEKPPQDNSILIENALTYRLLVVNAPMPVDTNLFYLAPLWNASTSYSTKDSVFFNWTYWQAIYSGKGNIPGLNIPGQISQWVETPLFPLKQAFTQRELRLTFAWPLRPNGSLGPGRQTYRETIAGQLVPTLSTNNPGQLLYFYLPQTFATP
jgi:type II secretory pathway pseudopilin PulG